MRTNKTETVDFQSLFESAPGLYLILLPDNWEIAAVSEAYLNATMTKRENIIGQYLFDVFPDNPDDAGATGTSNLKASLNSVVKTKTANTMAVQKYDIRRPDGTFEVRYWSPLNKPVLNSKNEISYIIHRVEDVTDYVRTKTAHEEQNRIAEGLRERVEEMEMEIFKRAQEIQQVNKELEIRIQQLKESEEQIQASQKIFSTVFYKSPVMNAITDATTGKFMDVNENFIEFCGLRKDEIIGRSSIELNMIVHPEHRVEMINSIKENGHSSDVTMKINTKNGSRWVSSSSHAVNIAGADCYLTAMIDITERKKAEEQLETVNKELESFSYSVSHDLRAPLRAVDGYARILEEDYAPKLDDEGRRLLQVVQYNAKKMGTLIDDLLAFSRLGKKELQKITIDMKELIEGALVEINKAVEHRAEIKIRKPHAVKGDYLLLNQVMVNLISNGIKYSSKKENPVVEISSSVKNNEVEYAISDNGAGFNMQYAHKLFGVFQRLHSTEEFEGTGVGLAIVQRIINKHGGKIWAEGKVGEGATFYFSLPS